jgi:glycosyltransferase involved in cell wall biosynthesis
MEIIHIVIGKANPERLNGVNKVVYQMATEQTNAGKQVQVWGLTQNPVHDYPERNFTTVLFKAERFPFAIPNGLKKAILSNKEAVFHLHGGWIPVFSSLSRIFRKHSIRFVITPHGAYNRVAMNRSAFQKKVYFEFFEKGLLSGAHKVHSIGESEVEGLNAFFPNDKSFLLPYGFAWKSAALKSKKEIPFTIGFVGRLDTYTKGLDLLIQAYQRFLENHPDARLWIVGDGEGMEFLKEYVQSNAISGVVFWGKKFGSEKDELLHRMHVFAHPSRNEGLPTAVLEALALGTPVVVTKATNVGEFVERYQAGISIPNEQVAPLVEGIEAVYQAYQNGEVAGMLTGAQHMLQEVFAWPGLVDQYDYLYA